MVTPLRSVIKPGVPARCWSGYGARGGGRHRENSENSAQCFAFTHLNLEESSGEMKLKSCFPADRLLVTTVCDLPLNADWMLSGAQLCLYQSDARSPATSSEQLAGFDQCAQPRKHRDKPSGRFHCPEAPAHLLPLPQPPAILICSLSLHLA